MLYGWAELAGEHSPTLRQLGRELALSAEIRAADAQLDRPLPHPRSVALLCAAMMRPSNQTLFWLALAQELQALAIAVHDMHQAAGEAQRASALADAIRAELAPLTAQLDDEHAAADPDYAETRQALRVARAGQPPMTDVVPARPTSRPRSPPPHLTGRSESPDAGVAERARVVPVPGLPVRTLELGYSPDPPHESRASSRPPRTSGPSDLGPFARAGVVKTLPAQSRVPRNRD